jgi:hypothetical protein
VKTKVIKSLVEQFNTLKENAEFVAKNAVRPGAIRNRIARFYQIKAVAEYYSKLLKLPTKKFNEVVDQKVFEMRRELKTFEMAS